MQIRCKITHPCIIGKGKASAQETWRELFPKSSLLTELRSHQRLLWFLSSASFSLSLICNNLSINYLLFEEAIGKGRESIKEAINFFFCQLRNNKIAHKIFKLLFLLCFWYSWSIKSYKLVKSHFRFKFCSTIF